MKKIFSALLLAGALAAPAAAQAEYWGGWFFDDNPGRYERMALGDGNGMGLYLSGTPDYCWQRGASYATMRSVIGRYDDWVVWWIDEDCGSVVRVCVQNVGNESACSSYLWEGWYRLD